MARGICMLFYFKNFIVFISTHNFKEIEGQKILYFLSFVNKLHVSNEN